MLCLAYNNFFSLGQTIGFTILCGLSLLGLVFNTLFRSVYVGYVGILPILMGLKLLRDIILENWVRLHHSNVDPSIAILNAPLNPFDADIVSENTNAIEYDATIRSRGESPADVSSIPNPNRHEVGNIAPPSPTWEGVEVHRPSEGGDSPSSTAAEEQGSVFKLFLSTTGFAFTRVFHMQTLEVIVVTTANGSDNVSVYLPLFADAHSGFTVLTYVITFYICLVIWVILAYHVIGLKTVSQFLAENGKQIIPFLYIAIGLYIMSRLVFVTNQTTKNIVIFSVVGVFAIFVLYLNRVMANPYEPSGFNCFRSRRGRRHRRPSRRQQEEASASPVAGGTIPAHVPATLAPVENPLPQQQQIQRQNIHLVQLQEKQSHSVTVQHANGPDDTYIVDVEETTT